jgi:zinc transporter ZupT
MLMTLCHFPWYIQPIVAVPAFLCADAFQKVLPFCTGFAAGCMIWIVIAEVLPDAFKVTNVWLSRKSKLLNLLFLNDSILQF